MKGAYFSDLSQALKEAGCHRPVLVIDRDRLDANIERIKARSNSSKTLRLVDKSLAVPALMTRLMERVGTQNVMTFHLPVTRSVLEQFPEARLLFGKPMPVAALEQAFRSWPQDLANSLSGRVIHLVDTPQRLADYADLARRLGIDLEIAVEVNIGLNRGGIDNPEQLSDLVRTIMDHPHIRLCGIMGYEAHIPAIPSLLGGAEKARRESDSRFAAFVGRLGEGQRMVLNTGGSKTILGYDAGHPATEISLGSAFLLPTDFDGGLLKDLQPALFIATQVLKTGPASLPGLPRLSAVLSAIGLFPQRGLFLYGGKWMARPEWPPGMKSNGLWGESSNQQFMGLARTDRIEPGNFAFFRPTQSEAVLQQFGPIAVYSDGRIIDFWQPLPPG